MCDKLVLAGAVASEGRAVVKRGGDEAGLLTSSWRR
jgi:hypothetical protein